MARADTQRQKIREALIEGRSLTPQDAVIHFGCMRLAARIHELREEGMAITKDMVTKGDATFARYRLEA